MRTALIPLRKHLRNSLQKQKDVITYNLAALQYIRRQKEAEHIAQFHEEDAIDEERIREKIEGGKKRKRVSIKA
jgi:U3 small nucleolar RNA-associated protein 12